jgi:hypothetical protein
VSPKRHTSLVLSADDAVITPVADSREGSITGARRDAPPPSLADTLPDFPRPFAARSGVPKVRWASSDSPLDETIRAAEDAEALIAIPAGEHAESIRISTSLHFVGYGRGVIFSDEQKECIHISGGASTFNGLKIMQRESQAYTGVVISAGMAVFRDCEISSANTDGVLLKGDGRAVFINCKISSAAKSAMRVDGSAAVFAQNCTFRSDANTAVIVRHQALAHFDGCAVENPQANLPVIRVIGHSQCLFENSRIFQPICLQSDGDFVVLRNCTIELLDLRVAQAARCLFDTCRFDGVSLEVSEQSGVTAMRSEFLGGAPGPSLRVSNATVKVDHCDFLGGKSATAVFVTDASLLEITNSLFRDLSGSAIFALRPEVELRLLVCCFQNIGASAIVAQDCQKVSVDKSLLQRVRGAGLLLVNAEAASVTGSQFFQCQNSGLEIRHTEAEDSPGEYAVEFCRFENNGNAGFYASGGKLAVKGCAFVTNAIVGLDIRASREFTVADSCASENGGGGFAISDGAKGSIESIRVSGAQAFGLAVRERSEVAAVNLTVAEGSSPAVFVGGRSSLSLEDGVIEGTAGAGILVRGQGTSARLVNPKVSGADAGLQALAGARVELVGGEFRKNGVHVEVAGSGLSASDAVFSASRDGIGVLIRPSAAGTFLRCSFSEEAKAGIAVGGQATITEALIEKCQLSGVYWYGGASGKIERSTIQNNDQCGIVVLDGKLELVGSRIVGHTVYGVHVNPRLRAAVGIAEDNEFAANTVEDVNYED